MRLLPWARRSSRRAFTMVELLMVASIVGLMAVVIGPLVGRSSTFFSIMTAKIELHRDARTCLAYIVPLIEQARPTTITITSPAGSPPYSRLAFTTVDGRAFVISQENRDLLVSINGGRPRPLSRQLSVMTFYFAGSSLQQIGVCLLFERGALGSRRYYANQYMESVKVANVS